MPFILLNKPAGILSQFTDSEDRATLAEYVRTPDVYSIGRLDRSSEGLLLLSDDGRLKHEIAGPKNRVAKTYWAQVEGNVQKTHLDELLAGVRSKGELLQATSAKVLEEPAIWPRHPPVRVRKRIPTSWLAVTLVQGRNRQVRRMTAATGLPTLRLIRPEIGPWTLGTLQPGDIQALSNEEARRQLRAWQRANC